MSMPNDDAPTFINTPKGDQLVIMTRLAYDRLIESATPESPSSIADNAMALQRRLEWEASGKPSVPLAVVRRVRAGDSYLKAVRVFRGLTQKDLADRVGIKQGYLSELETAIKSPSGQTREKLATALDIHPLFLSDAAPLPRSTPER